MAPFLVKQSKTEVVAAVLPMHEHWLPLSNLDLLLPPVDVGVFFCYESPITPPSRVGLSFESVVKVLKKALSQTLVSYYAFSGEMVANAAGEPELLCNNRGVDFVEAYADVELRELNLYNPDESIEGKLVPAKKNGVLSVQVWNCFLAGMTWPDDRNTIFSGRDNNRRHRPFLGSVSLRADQSPACIREEGIMVTGAKSYLQRSNSIPANSKALQVTLLSCGGVVVGCTFDHRVADAYSANLFLTSWAEMARSKPLSVLPSFRRSSLSTRRPGNFDSSIPDMYALISELPPPPPAKAESAAPPPISRIYSVSAEQIRLLQLLANYGNMKSKRTKLEAFSAFLWKIIATGTNAGESSSRLGIVVDGRTRIAGEKGEMGKYFGNVISIPFGEIKNKELEEMALSSIANEIRSFLDMAVTKEHFLGLIDFVEAHRPEPILARIYASEVTRDSPAVVVSSGQGFPIGKMDFGWGGAVFGSYHFPWGAQSGYVMPMPSPAGNGDWIVYMHLCEDQIEMIESNAGHVFKPFYLD